MRMRIPVNLNFEVLFYSLQNSRHRPWEEEQSMRLTSIWIRVYMPRNCQMKYLRQRPPSHSRSWLYWYPTPGSVTFANSGNNTALCGFFPGGQAPLDPPLTHPPTAQHCLRICDSVLVTGPMPGSGCYLNCWKLSKSIEAYWGVGGWGWGIETRKSKIIEIDRSVLGGRGHSNYEIYSGVSKSSEI